MSVLAGRTRLARSDGDFQLSVKAGSRFRRDPPCGGPGYARDVRAQAFDLINAQNRRVQVLGIEPELVLVLESNRQVKQEDVESAGLQILEMRSDKILVAFASDPELSEFLERCDKYGLGPRGFTAGGNERPAEYESLFDAVDPRSSG